MQSSTKWKKTTLCFHIYKIWQILKRFAGTFHRAQTLKLGGVFFKVACNADLKKYYCTINIFHTASLLPISGFVLDKKFQRNASKFAIFYLVYQNPKLLFPFFIWCNFMFLPNECPGLCRHRPGHSLGKKLKLLEMKNKQKTT